MPYDETTLTPVNVTGLVWAVNMVRVILRDTVQPYRFTDAELEAITTLHAFDVDGTLYYRPHIAAAALVQTDPERAVSAGIDNVNEQRVTPRIVAARIVREYAMLDRRIAAESGVHPDPGPGEAQVLF